MGLELDYFYSLTPRQFGNIQQGWQERRDAEMKMQMLLTRKTMFAALLPYSKNLTEQDLWPMEFDQENTLEFSEAEQARITQELEESKARWEARDAARKNKAPE